MATDLRINLYFSTLSAEQFSVDVTVEVSTGTIRALVSLLILTRWLLMHLTNKPVLSGCRYSAGNAMGIIVVVVQWTRKGCRMLCTCPISYYVTTTHV